VRNVGDLNRLLGMPSPIPSGNNLIPLVTLSDSLTDDVAYKGCPYASNTVKKRDDSKIMEAYADTDPVRNSIRDALFLTQEDIDAANWIDIKNYIDLLIAMKFEGISMPGDWTFTDQTWLAANRITNIFLVQRLTPEVRQLVLSRIMRKPLKVMERKVKYLIEGVK